ncbi:MAG: cytochrome c biogenesis protein DipZ [Candidatus Omnitrophica bacterium]|nr:cytochrome c biogenesis protein DipZ [Candidatus Omnitrophota bacterium]
MDILFLFSFIAGFFTILAPCIWPLLPIVLSVSIGEGKQRPLGVTFGVMTSFTFFTLSISYLEKFLHLDANLFRLAAVIIIILLGLMMLIPALGSIFETVINRLLSKFQNKQLKTHNGFSGGYTTGFFIGLLWAPCAGPILAAVATLAAIQAVNLKVVLVTIFYISGLGIPLFFLTLAGSKYFAKLRAISKYTGRIQQIFGLVMIIAALLIYTNYDKTLQIKILNHFPLYGSFLNRIENNQKVITQLNNLRRNKGVKMHSNIDPADLTDFGSAPEFSGIAHWFNTSSPLSMTDLRGKVVLIDFWTYTCINCVRTLPYVTNWYEKYKNNNFVVIGVHTPEFAFEKSSHNVENAIKQFNITYPVAQDNEYQTWQAFDNQYWPAEYLIDTQGHIRHTHFGEGNYEETEKVIKMLLAETGKPVDPKGNILPEQQLNYNITPETYLGKARRGQVLFSGDWDMADEYAQTGKGSSLEVHFKAAKVFLVISPHEPGDVVNLLIDGQPIPKTITGLDIKNGQLILDQERLYNLVDLKTKVESHILRLNFQTKGIRVYAFTFG